MLLLNVLAVDAGLLSSLDEFSLEGRSMGFAFLPLPLAAEASGVGNFLAAALLGFLVLILSSEAQSELSSSCSSSSSSSLEAAKDSSDPSAGNA